MSDYKTELKEVWCKGCGNYGILGVLARRVFPKLQIPNHQICIFSGIGCSPRITGYINTYGFNFLHGRAIAFAQGAKLAKPELTVLAIGGDGDFFSIGAGHLPHAVRRNINITCIMANNFVYALTKGQTSPTTPFSEMGEHDPRSFDENPPVDPILDMVAYSVSTKASFIAQGIATDPNHLSRLIEEGIKHRGFSFIGVLTACPTYRGELFNVIREKVTYLDEGKLVELPESSEEKPWIHDPSNIDLAFKLAKVPILERPYLGVFFRGKEKL